MEKPKIKFLIEWVVDIDSINTEEILDKLGETGSAEIVDAEVITIENKKK